MVGADAPKNFFEIRPSRLAKTTSARPYDAILIAPFQCCISSFYLTLRNQSLDKEKIYTLSNGY